MTAILVSHPHAAAFACGLAKGLARAGKLGAVMTGVAAREGTDGWLVPPRDVDALVERLRWCARNRDRLFSVGMAARERAEPWTWKRAEDELVRALAA